MTPTGYYTRAVLYIGLNVLTFADQSWSSIQADPAHFSVRLALAAVIAWRAFIDHSGSQLENAK